MGSISSSIPNLPIVLQTEVGLHDHLTLPFWIDLVCILCMKREAQETTKGQQGGFKGRGREGILVEEGLSDMGNRKTGSLWSF